MFPKQNVPKEFYDWIPSDKTRVLLFDIETNGLLDQTTKVHCLCAKDFLTGESFSFRPHEMKQAKALLDSYPLLVAHNGLCFDIPALYKLWGTEYRCFDTLTASRLIWTDLADDDFALVRSKKRNVEFPKQLIGRHSLKAWGYRLGCYKGNYGEVTENAWGEYSDEMLEYCRQDVEVLAVLYKHILDRNYSPLALALEHSFQQIMFDQEQTGVWFNKSKAVSLYADLSAKREELTQTLQAQFPPKEIHETFVPKVNNKTKGYVKGVPIDKVRYEPFNPASREQIAERLQSLGWTPNSFTETGQPVVDEETLAECDLPIAKKIIEYLGLVKIIGMIAEGKNAWLKLADENSRIHGKVITNGAVTGRCTHNSPNLAQIPARGEYGHACRELFGVDPNSILDMQVGCDASGLELRMLASYMAMYDHGAYIKTILEGDIHTSNQLSAGLPTRNDAKTFIYALMYGAGDAKLGSIVCPEKSESVQRERGRLLREKFYRNLPALQRLTEAVKKAAKEKKYLEGVDGRHLNVRSAHSALNTLLQSAGAVMMKLATCIFHGKCYGEGYVCGRDFIQVLHVHDEFQIQCPSAIADKLGMLAVESIEEAAADLGFPCPCTGEYKTGKTWADTH